MRAEARLHALALFQRHHAFLGQALGIDVDHGRMRLDRLVHQRLREHRLVGLVVAVAPVAEHVDDDRLLELLAELGGDLGDVHHRFRVVAVHVEDRRLDHARDVRAVGRGARVARVGREADLVVDDEVDRAAGAVTLEAGQAEAFRHHALAGERRVAVDEQRQHRRALARRAAALVLLGAHLAEHHRIDDLQVRGVGGQRQVHVVAVEGAIGRGAEVILHVARALDVVGLERAALELVEDRPVRLRHHAGEHVEPPAVRHADDDLFDAELAAALDDLLQRRHHRLRAVEAEALGAGVFHLAELLERLRLDQLVEDRAAPFRREADVLLLALDAILDPGLLRRARDVHELHADVPAVGAAQDAQDLAHGRRLEAEHAVDEDRPVEVGVGEAVGLGLQLAVHLAVGEAERVEVGGEMAHDAIGADQHQRADRILRRPQRGGRRHLEAERVRLGLQVVADRALARPRSRRSARRRARRCSSSSGGRTPHDGPRSPLRLPPRSSFRLSKKCRHSSLTEPGLRSYSACMSST